MGDVAQVPVGNVAVRLGVTTREITMHKVVG